MMRYALLAGLASLALTLPACSGLARGDESAAPQGESAGRNLPRAEQPAACPSEGAALQMLGSGGPIAEGGASARAGISYLLWIDGEPRLLIDAGAGSFLRWAQAGGKIETLDAILLSHVHADHVGDLAGILNSGGFEGRTAPLPVIGPVGGPGPEGRFPATSEFLARLLAKDRGAFSYNGGFLDGTEGKPMLEPRDIAVGEGDEFGNGAPTGLDISNDYSVMAHPVVHGPAPSIGFAIDLGDTSVIITADQNFQSERFLTELTGAKPTILFAHHVINGEQGQPRGLHRTPEEIGELAGALEPDRLVLTHNMERSLSRIEAGLEAIGLNYSGPVSVADDLDCYAL